MTEAAGDKGSVKPQERRVISMTSARGGTLWRLIHLRDTLPLNGVVQLFLMATTPRPVCTSTSQQKLRNENSHLFTQLALLRIVEAAQAALFWIPVRSLRSVRLCIGR